jgi:hypothetical protein
LTSLPIPGSGLPATCPLLPLCPAQIGDSGRGLADSIASAAAGSVLQGVAGGLDDAANWLVAQVIGLITNSASPQMGARWFATEMRLMEQIVLVVVLPVLMAATIGPVLRQDGRRLMRVWAVGLPLSLLAGLAASQVTGWGLAATDALSSVVLGHHDSSLAGQFGDAMGHGVLASAPLFVQMMVAMLVAVGALLVWLELVLRSAAVYVATFFMPLALVGYIWPATAGMARRSVEILASLILSKFVIVASVSLGLAALANGGVDSALSGAGILLIAAFAPFALLRLAPVVEASAIAHLEGLARRPVRAAGRAATGVASAPVHPVTQMVMSAAAAHGGAAAGGGVHDRLTSRPVSAQEPPSRAPDYPIPSASAGGRGSDRGHD